MLYDTAVRTFIGEPPGNLLMRRLALGALWPPVGEAPAHVAELVLMHRLVLGAL